MKSVRIILLLIIILLVSFYSCSDDNSPGGNKNDEGVSGIVITTTSATDTTNTSVVTGGNITIVGGSSTSVIKRGVCWSTAANPTISSSHTSDGSGYGVFTSIIKGLTSGILYYIRAYAETDSGIEYGNQITTITTTTAIGSCSGGPALVTDIDGNVYNVVSIGNQCWMQENLKTSHYKNGNPITTGLNDTQWKSTSIGACADYGNNPANTDIYGKLYNWYAVADTNGLCPAGWHVPIDSEWNSLVSYLGGDSIAGGAMKEIGLTHWININTGATNNSGFTGLPGGCRTNFFSVGPNSSVRFGYWWSATQSTLPSYRLLQYNNTVVGKSNSVRYFGFSVRCVRD